MAAMTQHVATAAKSIFKTQFDSSQQKNEPKKSKFPELTNKLKCDESS